MGDTVGMERLSRRMGCRKKLVESIRRDIESAVSDIKINNTKGGGRIKLRNK
jgi:hypothetical protein